MLVLGHIVGSYDLDQVLAAGDLVRAIRSTCGPWCWCCSGAFTKSAQFPSSSGCRNAMAAPTPVSSYLHSATMVKAGVFLLARLWPVLGDTEAWFWLVGGTGLATLLIGGYAAMFQDDLEGAAGLLHHLAPGPDHAAAGPEQPAGRRGRRVPHPEPRDLQGLAVHGRGHHRP